MSSLTEKWKGIWGSLSQSKTSVPVRVAIPADHVDNKEILKTIFKRDEQYFVIRINELYLAYNRQWFSLYDPMVFVVSEFTYNGKEETVPFVVGPSMLEKFGQEIPTGMIFSDTRVAGLHPYRGGRLNLSIILCKVKRDDYARKFLNIVESTSKVVDFSTALGNYVKVGGVVLEGIEAIMGMTNTVPIMGLRKEFDPDAGDKLTPCYFALIDMPESTIKPEHLWVRNNQLFYGKDHDESRQFREADYVLYSIIGTKERDDVSSLPFSDLWDRIRQEAMNSDDNSWIRAKGDMLALYQTLVLSPDLTPEQAMQLNITYKNEMKLLHGNAVDMSRLGEVKKSRSELDVRLRNAVEILDM